MFIIEVFHVTQIWGVQNGELKQRDRSTLKPDFTVKINSNLLSDLLHFIQVAFTALDGYHFNAYYVEGETRTLVAGRTFWMLGAKYKLSKEGEEMRKSQSKPVETTDTQKLTPSEQAKKKTPSLI